MKLCHLSWIHSWIHWAFAEGNSRSPRGKPALERLVDMKTDTRSPLGVDTIMRPGNRRIALGFDNADHRAPIATFSQPFDRRKGTAVLPFKIEPRRREKPIDLCW